MKDNKNIFKEFTQGRCSIAFMNFKAKITVLVEKIPCHLFPTSPVKKTMTALSSK